MEGLEKVFRFINPDESDRWDFTLPNLCEIELLKLPGKKTSKAEESKVTLWKCRTYLIAARKFLKFSVLS